MKKGLIFSFDSMQGISLVILGIGLATLYLNYSMDNEDTSEILEKEAFDAALAGFYKNKQASDYGLTDTTMPDAIFTQCTSYEKYGMTPESSAPALFVSRTFTCTVWSTAYPTIRGIVGGQYAGPHASFVYLYCGERL
jgi:hypothetical protein